MNAAYRQKEQHANIRGKRGKRQKPHIGLLAPIFPSGRNIAEN